MRMLRALCPGTGSEESTISQVSFIQFPKGSLGTCRMRIRPLHTFLLAEKHKYLHNKNLTNVVKFFHLSKLFCKKITVNTGLLELEPPYLAGAGAVFLVRLLLLLYSTVNILFLRDPKYDYKFDYDYDCTYDYDYDFKYDYDYD